MKLQALVITLLVFSISVLADFLLFGGEGESHSRQSHVYGFFALLGFLGCVAIILFSKILGSLWLQRKEGYYERERHNE